MIVGKIDDHRQVWWLRANDHTIDLVCFSNVYQLLKKDGDAGLTTNLVAFEHEA